MPDKMDPALIEEPYPFQRHIGMRMTGWQPDFARFELDIAEFLGNRFGIPHGGVYALLLDTCMGYSGCYTGDPLNKRQAMTLSMTTNFLGRPEGKLMTGEGLRVGGGKNTFFAEGAVRDETGQMLATASGVFRYRKGG